jgi:hypothetical protein
MPDDFPQRDADFLRQLRALLDHVSTRGDESTITPADRDALAEATANFDNDLDFYADARGAAAGARRRKQGGRRHAEAVAQAILGKIRTTSTIAA